MLGVFARLLARAAVQSTRIFYELSRQGSPLPPGPLVVVANHPNSWMDALVIFCTAGRRVRPLARAPIFDQLVMGLVLRGLDGLPVYRPQDDPTLMHRNETTFDAAVAALADGDAILVFPEGESHSEPGLAPLKTGAARIALRAEEARGWNLGLHVVPVGLTYRRKTAFRGRAAAYVGEAFPVAPWRRAYEEDSVAAAHALTDAIAEALERVTLTLSDVQDQTLVDAAEALYAAERGLSVPGEAALAARLPRLKLFEEGMNWLRAHDAERLGRLANAVASYRWRLSRLGIQEGELPESHPVHREARRIGVQATFAVLEIPLALLGLVAWYLPYMSPQPLYALYQPVYEARATVKLALALVVFPLTYAAWLALGWHVGGAALAAFLAVLLPLAGLATLHWRERFEDFRQDVAFVLRAFRRRGLTEMLRARRRELAGEIDRIADEWEAEIGRRVRTQPALPPG
jgi:1-acyl-sn-glycerol-3-phosphate acyltransferase